MTKPTPGIVWKDSASSFSFVPAQEMLRMNMMERHQNVRGRLPWLTANDQPLALLFISHRWKTFEHPDPDSSDLRAVQQFVRRVCECVEAMLLPRDERLRLVPSLEMEGTLQAVELARRILGFGPFGDATASVSGSEARRIVKEQFRSHRDDRPGFHAWLTRNIGVWLDYTCMPQKPLTPEEEPEFRKSLAALASLVTSATLVALRRVGDDYSARGWCASEYFLASGRSFARGLFIDVSRMERRQEVAITRGNVPQEGGIAAEVMSQSYGQDLAAFHQECQQWVELDGALIELTPPTAWSAYRDLQGSSFFAAEYDPNPFRKALQVVRDIETSLIQSWLMSEESRVLDIGEEIASAVERHGLGCADPLDLRYLGLLLAGHGWIEAFRPLFRECLQRYLQLMSDAHGSNPSEFTPRLMVRLRPLAKEVRALFDQLVPPSAAAWNSRLSTGPSRGAREREVVAQLCQALDRQPPEFAFAT